jgi:hypothetical protein
MGAWLLLLVIAIGNGGFRVGVLIPRLGDDSAHVVSTLMLALMITMAAGPLIGWIDIGSISEALAVGLVWVACTLAFEFLAGHYLFGNSWDRLLAEYDVRHGRIWVAVPFVTLLSPLLWAVTARDVRPD